MILCQKKTSKWPKIKHLLLIDCEQSKERAWCTEVATLKLRDAFLPSSPLTGTWIQTHLPVEISWTKSILLSSGKDPGHQIIMYFHLWVQGQREESIILNFSCGSTATYYYRECSSHPPGVLPFHWAKFSFFCEVRSSTNRRGWGIPHHFPQFKMLQQFWHALGKRVT